MTLNPTMVRGWAQACFLILVLWGLINVAFRYSSQVLEVHSIIFTCAAFLSSSFILLIMGGAGSLGRETMRSVDTWAYGVVLLLLYLLNLYLFDLVTSTEGTLLQRLSLVVSLLSAWLFLGRQISALQALGSVAVIGGMVVICSEIPAADRSLIYAIIMASATVQALQIFIAEIHRPHKQAVENTTRTDPKAKTRVVGYVMFVISTLFLAIMLVLALLNDGSNSSALFAHMPQLSDFTDANSILYGMALGVFLIAPIKVLEFSSAASIKTENFLAVACLAPIATLFWEWLLAPVTGLSLKDLSTNDLIAGAVITFGGFLVAISNLVSSRTKKSYEDYLTPSIQDPDAIADSREILANTLEHFNGDVDKAAKSLDTPKEVLNALLNDADKTLAFKPITLKRVARKFRKNVALSDALTGLTNRAGFMTALKTAEYETPTYSVLYIDLDKFKPVNDTYGHDAGDFVLKGVAERLGELFPKDALSTRLGGDEFATLLLGKTKEEAHHAANLIKEELAKAFHFNDTSIAIGASVGVATFPEDGSDAESLLKVADQGMYSGKRK